MGQARSASAALHAEEISRAPRPPFRWPASTASGPSNSACVVPIRRGHRRTAPTRRSPRRATKETAPMARLPSRRRSAVLTKRPGPKTRSMRAVTTASSAGVSGRSSTFMPARLAGGADVGKAGAAALSPVMAEASGVGSPLRVFAERDYRPFWASRLLGSLGSEIQSVTMGWQVYAISRRTLDVPHAAFNVSLIGLCTFAPLFFLALLAGESADRYEIG